MNSQVTWKMRNFLIHSKGSWSMEFQSLMQTLVLRVKGNFQIQFLWCNLWLAYSLKRWENRENMWSHGRAGLFQWLFLELYMLVMTQKTCSKRQLYLLLGFYRSTWLQELDISIQILIMTIIFNAIFVRKERQTYGVMLIRLSSTITWYDLEGIRYHSRFVQFILLLAINLEINIDNSYVVKLLFINSVIIFIIIIIIITSSRIV
jgi:hypothetical protein